LTCFNIFNIFSNFVGQLRYSKASTAKSCTDLGKSRVALVDADNNTIDGTPTVLSNVRFRFGASVEKIPPFYPHRIWN
jgi:hypothetical protein